MTRVNRMIDVRGILITSTVFIFILIFSVWIKIDTLNEQLNMEKSNCYLQGTDLGALLQEKYIEGTIDILDGDFTGWCEAHATYGVEDELRAQDPDLYEKLCGK